MMLNDVEVRDGQTHSTYSTVGSINRNVLKLRRAADYKWVNMKSLLTYSGAKESTKLTFQSTNVSDLKVTSFSTCFK